MTDEQYRVVSDDLRTMRKPTKTPAADDLRAGRTVFVPLNGVSTHVLQNRYRSLVRPAGMRLRYRTQSLDNVEGLVMWTEPIGGAA